MSKIFPFLWFDDQAEEAVTFYTSIFKNSKIGSVFPLRRCWTRTKGLGDGDGIRA